VVRDRSNARNYLLRLVNVRGTIVISDASISQGQILESRCDRVKSSNMGIAMSDHLQIFYGRVGENICVINLPICWSRR
jgi:hypothetical protein